MWLVNDFALARDNVCICKIGARDALLVYTDWLGILKTSNLENTTDDGCCLFRGISWIITLPNEEAALSDALA